MGQQACTLCGHLRNNRIAELIEEREVMQIYILELEQEVKDLGRKLEYAILDKEDEDYKWETTKEELEMVRAEITNLREESQSWSPFERVSGMFPSQPVTPLSLSMTAESIHAPVVFEDDSSGQPPSYDNLLDIDPNASEFLERALRNAESQIESSHQTRQAFSPRNQDLDILEILP